MLIGDEKHVPNGKIDEKHDDKHKGSDQKHNAAQKDNKDTVNSTDKHNANTNSDNAADNKAPPHTQNNKTKPHLYFR